jgi:predicted transposase/invertase (TIGR01784 family)
MKKGKSRIGRERQINQYDKILHENIESALPGLIKNVLHIQAIHSEELPDSIQHTKERKPDLLKKITDDKGNTFVLHIEFQTNNDAEMVYRMAEYLVMLLRMYKIPVKQYVIYIGEGTPTMPTTLVNENSYFNYNLITISAIDYHIFLRSDNPEEKMFAILADFGSDSAEMAITNIVTEITKSAKGDLERERRKKQLRILAQLRNLATVNIEVMERVSSFFKEENDIFYQVGEKRGLEKGKALFIKYLLTQTDYSSEKIAKEADVPVSFVENIRASLAKPSE